MLRIAVLGTGNMANAHCSRLKQIPGVELSAVVSRGGEKKTLPGAEGAQWVSHIAQLKGLAQPVDVALVCLPGYLHRAAVEELAAFVPHIICEKPAALCRADAQAMGQAAAQGGCNLMVAQVLRVWDSYTALGGLLEERRDSLHSITLRRRQRRPAWSAGDWLMDREKSGGILYDLAIHDIDFLTSRYGAPLNTSGSLGAEGMSATLLLTYPEFCAVVQSSWTLPPNYCGGLDIGVEVAFEDGLAVFGARPGSYHIYDSAGEREVPFQQWDAYTRQLEQMLDCIRAGGGENPFSLESTLSALDVCDRMMAQQNKG